ncbi:hypothetical protein [Geomonas edaphica]|uniref:hypothetical protein n=1 Tax=Geomonas edaphica TaxID=2570226 RepID=UPI0010A809F3|nr:hypothetical protein [Geomonas edaphica]
MAHNNNIPHPEMVAKSEEVRQGFTTEVRDYLVSLLLTPESYDVLHERFEKSVTGFYKGDPEKVKECEEARRDLEQAISVIQGVRKALSVVDPSVYEKPEDSHQKSSTAGAALAAAKDLRIFYDKGGQPYCSFTKLPGSKGHEIWFCTGEPGVEANWSLLMWSTTCQKMYLKGLNRTRTNYLKLRCKRGNEVGPWSNMIILPPV